jgi:tetratricopeptide (TPR) repeat protein
VSELRLETVPMPTAPIGPENPLPPLFACTDLHQVSDYGDADTEMRRNIDYGRVTSVLPYLLQDGYDRERRMREHRVAVLENDTLRATFLLGLGGRLWSLEHRPTGRELLHRNPVVQPANLALRNAWVAGGVEWNIGTIGHSALTCEPLHAVRVDLPDGTPALRMYEVERIREVVFQVDAWLPAASPVLLVHVRIVNPNDHEVPVYWWSNTAAPQADGVRVLAPARGAWTFTYDGSVRRATVPVSDGSDLTYPARSTAAGDHFFEIGDGDRRWIAALDADGAGLVQTSTDLLRGRKLFQWGTGAGGDHWQEWLSGPGSQYLEIQAGLARTQLEHLPLAARSSLSWVEGYGMLEADPAAVHSEDWDRAVSAVAGSLESLMPRRRLDRAHDRCAAWQDAEPGAVLQAGSGWGALERRLRQDRGDEWPLLPGTPFPEETLGAAQRPWLDLLRTGRMEQGSIARAPVSYQTSRRWTRLLEAASGWLPLLHLGVLRTAEGDPAGAADAWSRSLDACPTAWAHRNLAALAARDGDRPAALGHYQVAVAMRPDLLPLALEYVDLLLDAGDASQAVEVLEDLPAASRRAGRTRLAEARAALRAGDLARCGDLLRTGVEVPDLREGDDALHDLWWDFRAALAAAERGRPVDPALRAEVAETVEVPRRYDFRMRP